MQSFFALVNVLTLRGNCAVEIDDSQIGFSHCGDIVKNFLVRIEIHAATDIDTAAKKNRCLSLHERRNDSLIQQHADTFFPKILSTFKSERVTYDKQRAQKIFRCLN